MTKGFRLRHFFQLLLGLACLWLAACNNAPNTDSTENFSLMDLGSAPPDPDTLSAPQPLTRPALKADGQSDKVFYGLDVSHYQGNLIENLQAHDSLSFLFCKATQGEHYEDPDFRENWHEIRAKGLIRGAYHFYACSDDPVKQADHFYAAIEDMDTADIAPVLDIEQGSLVAGQSKDKMQRDILRFLRRLESKTGRKPILYTDYAFAQEYLTHPQLESYALWLAEYSHKATPLVPDRWKSKGFKIWQRSDSYTIDSKSVDYDVYYGPLEGLLHD